MNNHNKEVRIGAYLVDGLCVELNTVYEFNGCVFHNCPYDCFITQKVEQEKWFQTRMKAVTVKHQEKYKYIAQKGYPTIDIFECKFIANVKGLCSHIYDRYLPLFYNEHRGTLTSVEILEILNAVKRLQLLELLK